MIKGLLTGKNTGAAESVRRWWYQRLSAVALLPLTLWCIYDLVTLHSLEYAAVRAVARRPVHRHPVHPAGACTVLSFPNRDGGSHRGLRRGRMAQDRGNHTWQDLIAALCALASMLAVMAVTMGM